MSGTSSQLLVAVGTADQLIHFCRGLGFGLSFPRDGAQGGQGDGQPGPTAPTLRPQARHEGGHQDHHEDGGGARPPDRGPGGYELCERGQQQQLGQRRLPGEAPSESPTRTAAEKAGTSPSARTSNENPGSTGNKLMKE